MKLALKFRDGSQMEIKLETSAAPITVSKLLASLPLNASIIKAGPQAIIPLDLGTGPETFRTFARRGEVIYVPKNKQLIIAISNIEVGDRINPIGFLMGEPDKLRPGTVTLTQS